MTPPWFKSVKEILFFHVDGFMSENQEEVIALEKNIIVVFSVYHIKWRQDRTIVKPKETLSIWNVYKTLKPPVKAEGPLF